MTVVDDFIAAELLTLTPILALPVAPFLYGSDLDCVSDIAEDAAEISADSPRSLAQGVLRAWSTPPGSLLDDPGYGYDLVGLLHSGVPTEHLDSLGGQLSAEALRDDRIDSLNLKLTLGANYKSITINAVLTPADSALGEFSFVAAVSDELVATLELRG